MFSRWQELGELTIFEDSNICDYDMIVRDIEEINKLIPIRKIYYDSWNSSQMVVQLVKLGYDTSPYSMSNFSMNAALTGYFKLINDGYLFMPDSKALKFQFPCIEVVQDYRGNVMIKKDNYRKKRID